MRGEIKHRRIASSCTIFAPGADIYGAPLSLLAGDDGEDSGSAR